MTRKFAVFLAVFMLIYALLQWAIGWHIRTWLTAVAGAEAGGWAFWVLFSLVAFSYPAGKLLSLRKDAPYFRALTLLGSYWLAVMFYLILLLPPADLAAWLLGRFGGVAEPAASVGWIAAASLAALMARGAANARRPVARDFRIRIPKQARGPATLKIAVASDLHLGGAVGRRLLERLVREVNAFGPDLVLLPGDIVDDEVGPFLEKGMPELFRKLAPRLGVYACPGNHDPFGGREGEKFAEAMAASGIRMLMDETVNIGGELTLAGRLDRSAPRYGLARKKLAELLEGADRSVPVVLLDHQPLGFSEAEEAGVDLMLCGHTHRGQMAPNHLLTRRLFDLDWGYLSRGGFHAIVSSGYGFWGPPIRIGSRCEWIRVTLELH